MNILMLPFRPIRFFPLIGESNQIFREGTQLYLHGIFEAFSACPTSKSVSAPVIRADRLPGEWAPALRLTSKSISLMTM